MNEDVNISEKTEENKEKLAQDQEDGGRDHKFFKAGGVNTGKGECGDRFIGIIYEIMVVSKAIELQ